jgi:hypothetical protein
MISVLRIFCITCITLLLCGCFRFPEPIHVEESVLADAQTTKFNDIVLSKRVFVERGSEKATYYFGEIANDVTATSNFGEEHEIANLDCIATGIHQTLETSSIVPTDKFWDAIGKNYETLNFIALFDKNYLSKLDGLDADYLIVSHHQRMRIRTLFIEIGVKGAAGRVYEEKASALIVDIKQRRIVDAIQVNSTHSTAVAHLLFIPHYHETYPEGDPCEVIGQRAAESIVQSSELDRAPRIIIVAAQKYPYGPKLSSGEIREIKKQTIYSMAQKGYPESQWRLYAEYGKKPEDAIWLCHSANAGYAKAQLYIGHFYWNSPHIIRNKSKAYVWYRLAATGDKLQGLLSDERIQHKAATAMNDAEKVLSVEELAIAGKLYEEWNTKQCEREILPVISRSD